MIETTYINYSSSDSPLLHNGGRFDALGDDWMLALQSFNDIYKTVAH